LRLSTQHGFPFFGALGAILHGGALAEHGRATEGILQIQEGLAAWQHPGADVRSYPFALLAEAYKKAGQTNEGLTALAETLNRIEKNKEQWWAAELHRLKGELTLQLGIRGLGLGTGPASPQTPSPQSLDPSEAEAEACFHKAIAIAQKQHAKSWELRTATSLARLWQSQGKTTEARDLLALVYNWFTEGFDTADLRDAKALLEELS